MDLFTIVKNKMFFKINQSDLTNMAAAVTYGPEVIDVASMCTMCVRRCQQVSLR